VTIARNILNSCDTFKPFIGRETIIIMDGKRPSSTYWPDASQSYQVVDAAQTGDICALLIPSYGESIALKSRLKDLHKRYGGEIASPLHLTCQRFRATTEQLEQLKPRLIRLATATPPLPLMGQNLEPFYSTFRQQEILKCRITPTEKLVHFVTKLSEELEDLGIDPHFPWVSELVTLFEDIQVGLLRKEDYPQRLFWGQRLVLTQIKAPGRYKALFSASLSQLLEPTSNNN